MHSGVLIAPKSVIHTHSVVALAKTALISAVHAAIVVLRMQLLLTLFCLPILTSWGLAIPILTMVGNLFFIPFLTLFIALGICILCSWVLHADVRPFCYALNSLTSLWMWLLSRAPTSWNIVMSQSIFIPTLLGPIMAIILIRHRWFARHSMRQMAGAFAYISLLSAATFLVCRFNSNTIHIKRARVGTTIIWDGYKTVLVDWGSLNALPGGLSWVQYQLLPALYDTTGTGSIDTLILTHQVKKIRPALQALARRCTIDTIIVPDQTSQVVLRQATIAHAVIAVSDLESAPIALSNQRILVSELATRTSKRCLDVVSQCDNAHEILHDAFKQSAFSTS